MSTNKTMTYCEYLQLILAEYHKQPYFLCYINKKVAQKHAGTEPHAQKFREEIQHRLQDVSIITTPFYRKYPNAPLAAGQEYRRYILMCIIGQEKLAVYNKGE